MQRWTVPCMDRIDVHIEVPRLDYEKLSGDRVGESSEVIRARVQAGPDHQRTRFSSKRRCLVNLQVFLLIWRDKCHSLTFLTVHN